MKKEPVEVINELVRRLNEHARRLRAIEERLQSFEVRISSLENNFLLLKKSVEEELKRSGRKLDVVVNTISMLSNEVEKIRRELGKTAKKVELKEIEEVISLLNPIASSFVSREEVKRIVREEIRQYFYRVRSE